MSNSPSGLVTLRLLLNPGVAEGATVIVDQFSNVKLSMVMFGSLVVTSREAPGKEPFPRGEA